MTDLKQKLEAVRDRMAYSYEVPAHRNCYECCKNDSDYENAHKAGFSAAIPIILEMAKSLRYYSKKDFDRVCFLDHATCEENYGAYARDVLNKLKQFIEINGDSIGK